jgi:hypothetical protein
VSCFGRLTQTYFFSSVLQLFSCSECTIIPVFCTKVNILEENKIDFVACFHLFGHFGKYCIVLEK